MFSDIVASELRSLRFYAQLMTGSTDEGDRLVCDTLSSFILPATVGNFDDIDRIQLFGKLDEKLRNSELLNARVNTVHPLLLDLSDDERRILLLSVVGGFEGQQLAQVTGMTVAETDLLKDRVESIVSAATRTGVLIIEDEPHMAELLSLLVEQTGHWVAGIAHTREQALDLAQQESFGLILSDLELNQASCGMTAVSNIRETLGRHIPTVYITAHPERLASHDSPIRDGFVAKPFDIWRVREAVNQAICVPALLPAS